ncbi:MAG: helix-turn-helix domain-containing protein [Chloroflexi bacterium]|nr:helix-turn-helix domain-containing protein [Chloroflexota bacterium]
MSAENIGPRPPAIAQVPRRPDVGSEVRRWRQTRTLTLAEVGIASGLNVGYLSQIENGKAVPSLDALAAIAAALDVPIAWLFLDSAPAPRVVRHADRPRREGPDGAVFEEVDGGTARDVRILEAVVPVGASTGIHAHTGDEHHVVLSGRWRMTQGSESFDVGPGDYVAWDPTIPHDVECLGPELGRLLVVYPRHARRNGEPAGALRA